MKNLIFIALLCWGGMTTWAQSSEETNKERASCIWCLRFKHLVTTTPELKSILDKKYIFYHLNYSPENKNEKAFAKYGNPGAQFGYPAFLILSPQGEVLYTQKSEELESGKGYDLKKVKKFLLGRL